MTTKFVYRIEKNKNKPNEFIYQYNNGTVINNDDILKRIKSIGCPPAWRDVEINPNANAELGCTGFDIAGRKQWKYTQLHDLRIEKEKFCKLINFGDKLPKIREKYENILLSNSHKKLKQTLIALILKIIETCNFRIGTERCRKTYDSHGMTTILKEHVDIKSDNLAILDFIGKKGVRNYCEIKDPVIIAHLNKIKYNASNKEKIFKYQDDKKGTNYITFLDINKFLLEFGNFTSKMFRTWSANKYLLEELNNYPIDDKITNRKKTLRKSIETIAEKLHHTSAICKSKYLCRELLDLYVNEPDKFKNIMNDNKIKNGLNKPESIFYNFLKNYYKKKFCNKQNKQNKPINNTIYNNNQDVTCTAQNLNTLNAPKLPNKYSKPSKLSKLSKPSKLDKIR